jgi:hypothetical protein
MAKSDYLTEIKDLETRLVKLRLATRHIDFAADYDYKTYSSQKHKTQSEIQQAVISYLTQIDKPISNAELISNLVKTMHGLGEKDFEKTGSGSIRIYSGIRSAVVNLKRNKILSIPKRGQLILTGKIKPNI